MSTAQPLRTTTGLLLVALMVLPAFSAVALAATPATPPTTPAQDEEIQAHYDRIGAPYGKWQKANTWTDFYLHGDCTDGSGAPPPAPPATPVSAGAGCAEQFHNLQRGNDPNARHDTVMTFGSIVSFLPEDCTGGGLHQETTIYRANARLFAESDRLTSANFLVQVYQLDQACQPVGDGVIAEFELGNSDPGTLPAPIAGGGGLFADAGFESIFTGEQVLACDEHDLQRIYGCTLPAGSKLRFDVQLIGGNINDVHCEFTGYLIGIGLCASADAVLTLTWGDQYVDSSFGVYADSVRMNMWTEDRFGKPTDTYISSDVGSNDERKVHFRAVQMDTWGGMESVGCVPTYLDRSYGCPNDNIDQFQMRFRVFDRETEKHVQLDQGRGLINYDGALTDSYIGCCNSHTIGNDADFDPTRAIKAEDSNADEQLAGLQFYEYTLAYADDFPDGDYRIEFQESRRLWTLPLNFFIGGHGFSFTFADYEPTERQGTLANHTVFIEEPTKYHMLVTNEGRTTDTFSLTAPVPGLGWQATLTPQIVTLAPGGQARVEITVVPPASARPGDIKVIEVQAASVEDNSIKSLYTQTTVTAARVFGVDILAPTVQAIETRPQKTELFPVIVANNGTVRNTYVVTPESVPDGWIVSLNPSFMGAYAGTREAVVASITAPAEAAPGFSFTLELKACPNQKDHGLCDVQPIPVRVYLVDGLKVDVLADVFQDEAGFENVGRITYRDAQEPYTECTNIAICFIDGTYVMQDGFFDDSAMFRIRVENTGDRTDDIQLTAAWDPDQFGAWGARDVASCDSTETQERRDGVPDGWRFRFLDGQSYYDPGMVSPIDTTLGGRLTMPPGTPYPVEAPAAEGGQTGSNHRDGSGGSTPFSGEMYAGTLRLPAHTAQYVWVEMFWVEPVDDSSNGAACIDRGFDHFDAETPSTKAMLRVSYRSSNDGTKEGAVRLVSELRFNTEAIQANGREPRSIPAVLMETHVGQEDIGFAPKSGPTPYARYSMLATNTGQEFDVLTIKVDAGRDGWKHVINTFPVGLASPPGGTGIVHTQATTMPAAPTRPAPNCVTVGDDTLTCSGIGVYDAIAFEARAIPPSSAKVGDTDLMTVSVFSKNGDAATGLGIRSEKVIRTFVQGAFGFSIQTPDGLSVNPISPNAASGPGIELHGYPGQTIAVPFTIRNVGLSNDRYEVTVSEGDRVTTDGDASWNPQLSQGTIVAVPAGLDYHGFLGITIPDDAPITAEIQAETEPLGDDVNGNGVRDFQGDLVVTDTSEHFRIKVVAHDNPTHQTATLDVYVPVVETPQAILSAEPVSIATDAYDAIPLRADQAGDFLTVEFDGYYLDALDQFPSLPRGYEWACLPEGHPRKTPLHPCTPNDEYRVKVNYAAVGPDAKEAINQLEVYVPPNQLGVSRIAHRIWGESAVGTERDQSWVDAVVNLRSTYGVRMYELFNQTSKVLPPGSLSSGVPSTIFNVVVENAGLTPQTVLLSNSDLPPGWQIFYDSASATVQPPGFQLDNPQVDCPQVTLCRIIDPQSRSLVKVGLIAPADADPDDAANILIFGTVQQDKTQVAQLALQGVVGRFEPTVGTTGTDGLDQAVYAAPQEVARFAVRIANAGTITDEISVTALLPASVKDSFPIAWDEDCPKVVADEADPLVKSCIVQLAPGQARIVSLLVTTPDQLVPTREEDPGYVVSLTATSLLSPKPVSGLGTANLRILDYVSQDVDGDGAKEYAIDRNRDNVDGFEQFRENLADAGVATRGLSLENFLNDATRTARTIDGVLQYTIPTSSCDVAGHTDHFLDSDADGLPDLFWIPGKRAQALTLQRDTNGDQVVELFVDCEGDGKFDELFDMANGEFRRLLQRFIDADEFVDYVIDVAHGSDKPNGQPDKDETVIFGGPLGAIAKIQFNLDMNGDGDLDAVVDEDGDGDPDYFIPFGKVSAIRITLKDVTGDKVLDWTYDSTGENGRPNAYYDPIEKRSALIDTKAEFVRDLLGHWYIFVLFGLALVLFVVLVLVTRRR